jgi:hypothetical protein
VGNCPSLLDNVISRNCNGAVLMASYRTVSKLEIGSPHLPPARDARHEDPGLFNSIHIWHLTRSCDSPREAATSHANGPGPYQC